ncbi:MAG: UDP-N-acetylmuramoyl-L-alanine--D-glutamate ligase, partial [Planctomycetaceae bacterium]
PGVDEIQPEEWIVLELSSFQLHDLDGMFASPQVAVVTNFSPNHLDWHGSLAEYRRAKQTILRWQTDEGLAVLNAADADVTTWKTHGRRLAFNVAVEQYDQPGVTETAAEAVFREKGRETAFPLAEWLRLPGRHNRQNALAACCAALAMGVDVTAVKEGLTNFTPLPHRLEFVAEAGGRRFYNDSLATTPESTLFALESFNEPIVLLAGGYDKQVDLTMLAEAIRTRAKAAALMGQTAAILADLLETAGERPPLRECHSFDEAFRWACEQSAPGDVVLLSPGCASYDWFRNFAERGERFRELVAAFRRDEGVGVQLSGCTEQAKA